MANFRNPTLLDLTKYAYSELDNSVNKPNILRYGEKPYPEQERFHRSTKKGRFLSGGNRGGKTDALVVESIWWATDTHPYLARPEEWGRGALEQRFIVVDIAKGVEQIMLPKFKRWATKGMLIGGLWENSWDNANKILTFSNGSTIDFLTHGMDLDKHGGVPRHVIYFDEEPPQNIFNEAMMRLLDYEGIWVIAATPVKGMGWTYDLLWEPAQNNPEGPVDTFTLSADQNPYILTDTEEFDFYMMGMNKEEREVREHGTFVARSGLVFTKFSMEIEKYVLDDFRIPKDCRIYSSVDHGWNSPTAWVWSAVSPSGEIVTFGEHYADHMTVGEHAAVVHEREKAWGIDPSEIIRTGDPALLQGNGVTGTNIIQAYAEHGIYIGVEGVPRSVLPGIEKMQEYLRIRDDDTPAWKVVSNCSNLIREMKKLRWATYESEKHAYSLNKREEIHKKDDHAPDALRYFFTLMPNLAPEVDSHKSDRPITLSYQDLMAKMSGDPEIQMIDNEGPNWQSSPTTGDLYQGAF